MKKAWSLILALVILSALMADIAVGARAESLNPLPDIYEAVSSAVVSLVRVTNKWDENTNAVWKEDEGLGSAVLIDERGYFLTNHHVVDGADEMEVRLGDGTAFEAYLVGADEATDVAVVKVDEPFPAKPVTVGSSAALRVGEQVCVIGTPLSEKMLYNTLTVGYVAGLDREDADPESTRAVGLIQIDAAVNPGNSGGALLNMKGELVGIPFMKYMGYYYKTAEEEEFVTYENLAFAVPMDVAWPVAQSIIETGKYTRPRFGVTVLSITGPEEPLKNYPPAGLQVQEIEKKGSGAKAGLRVNDVITHVNGTRIYDFREYTKIIDKLPDGASFTITVARYDDANGEKLRKPEVLDLVVTLEIID